MSYDEQLTRQRSLCLNEIPVGSRVSSLSAILWVEFGKVVIHKAVDYAFCDLRGERDLKIDYPLTSNYRTFGSRA